jgi:multidrug efflux pump subunit AcrA (membrane-fusion protein)
VRKVRVEQEPTLIGAAFLQFRVGHFLRRLGTMYRSTGRLIGLVLVTLCALAVMVTFGAGRWFGNKPENSGAVVAPEASAASVIVKAVRREPIEIIDRYSGTIEPLEKFSLGFQIAGRLESLGEGDQGRPLDEGDEVICRRPASPRSAVGDSSGADDDRRVQILKDFTQALAPEGFLVSPLLARLDSELLRAQRDELMVHLEQAHYDREKAYKLWQRKAITDTEYQTRKTDFAAASFRYRAADRRLRDSQLRLVVPAHGAVQDRSERRFIISKRRAIPGETLNSHQTVFELHEVDRVKLVVGVPESRVRELDLRLRDAQDHRRRARAGELVDAESLQVPVHVRLLGTRRFGGTWPALEGHVHQISEAAGNNGLFDVEIILDNPDGTLRPGLFAMADIVIDRIDGFRLPRSAIRYSEDGTAYLFSVNTQENRVENNNENHARPLTATRYELGGIVEQGSDVIVRDLPVQHQTVVIRGQHRLTPGRRVEIVEGSDVADNPVLEGVPKTLRVPTVGSKP